MTKGRKHFKIDARAMLTWGRESIKDPTTAIIELVKNSYDAGASVVEVSLKTLPKEEERFIRIADDGEGMSEREIDAYWLRLGFSVKREKPKQGGRRRTGEKGIGRISADRLGGTLELRTQKKGEAAIGLVVDWSAYEIPGQELSSVPIQTITSPVFKIPRPAKKKDGQLVKPPPSADNTKSRTGTELLIRNLRDQWTEEDVAELRRALAALRPPFDEPEGFQIRLQADREAGEEEAVTSPFFDSAELQGEFSIDHTGQVSYSFTARDKRGRKVEGRDQAVPWQEFVHSDGGPSSFGAERQSFGPARVTLLFYPRHTDTLRGTDLSLNNLRRFLDVHSGVKVYRDLIRVMPYGDPAKPEGDWLGLGDRKARSPAGPARPDYRISPNQLVGAVFLSRDKNPGIADTTGREGLVHADEYDELRAFIEGCVVRLEREYHLRFSKQKKEESRKQDPREAVKILGAELKKLAKSLKTLQKSIPDTFRPEFEEASAQVSTTQQAIEETKKSIEELASHATVYRGLASLGIAAATFGHETLGAIDGIRLFISAALDSLGDEKVDANDVAEELEKALRAAERISAWGRFTLGRVRKDKRRRRTVDVAELVGDLLNEIEPPFAGSSIAIQRSLRSATGRVFPMDIEAVLINLLTNAYYFVRRSKRKRAVKVSLAPVKHDGDAGIRIVVSDSGPGVPRDLKDDIWRPLVTTRVDEKNRGVGTGLGLAIVDATVQELGGWRDADLDPDLHGARFSVWLPMR